MHFDISQLCMHVYVSVYMCVHIAAILAFFFHVHCDMGGSKRRTCPREGLLHIFDYNPSNILLKGSFIPMVSAIHSHDSGKVYV